MFQSNRFLSIPVISLILSCPHSDIPFSVEVAQTPEEQARGLMFRTTLPDDGGMLFSYDSPRPVSMWMKNTLIPLDMIFGDRNGQILAIYENTTPYSLDMIGPVKATTYVLEVPAGTVSKHGITKSCAIFPKALAP